MYQEKTKAGTTTHVDEDDQCMTCEHFCKGVACPLLESLQVGITVLTDDVTVSNCGFYVKHKRSLKVLPFLQKEGSLPPLAEQQESPEINEDQDDWLIRP